mgnify:CR=1 FL=1
MRQHTMNFIFEINPALGAAKDISEDQPSLCISSNNSNGNLVLSSDESSLSDNEDVGFNRRALILALTAYKIIKKKEGFKKV